MLQDASNSPYTAPRSNVTPEDTKGDRPSAEVALYSPGQVGIGVFLGGPVAFIYFLHSNFRHLGESQKAINVLLGGVALIAVAFAVVLFAPTHWIGYGFSLGSVFLARSIARSYQTPNYVAVPHYRQSGWKVFGLSVACLILSVLIIAVPIIGLAIVKVALTGHV